MHAIIRNRLFFWRQANPLAMSCQTGLKFRPLFVGVNWGVVVFIYKSSHIRTLSIVLLHVRNAGGGLCRYFHACREYVYLVIQTACVAAMFLILFSDKLADKGCLVSCDNHRRRAISHGAASMWYVVTCKCSGQAADMEQSLSARSRFNNWRRAAPQQTSESPKNEDVPRWTNR